MFELDSLLVTIDPAPYPEALRQAEALLASDEAALEFRKSEAVRFADLDTNAVTRSDFERTHAEAGAQEHKVRADRAVVEQARLNLGYCSIHSPITGRTGAYLLKQGSVVEANKTTFLVINQIEPIYVTFSVPEKHLTAIRAAQQKAPLTVEARIPGADAHPRLGRLTFIDNAVDPATGMIRLKGTFANTDAFLWPGQYVRVTLIVGEEPRVVVTPPARSRPVRKVPWCSWSRITRPWRRARCRWPDRRRGGGSGPRRVGRRDRGHRRANQAQERGGGGHRRTCGPPATNAVPGAG